MGAQKVTGRKRRKGGEGGEMWHGKIAKSTGSRYLEIPIYLSQAGGKTDTLGD